MPGLSAAVVVVVVVDAVRCIVARALLAKRLETLFGWASLLKGLGAAVWSGVFANLAPNVGLRGVFIVV